MPSVGRRCAVRRNTAVIMRLWGCSTTALPAMPLSAKTLQRPQMHRTILTGSISIPQSFHSSIEIKGDVQQIDKRGPIRKARPFEDEWHVSEDGVCS